MYQHTPSTAQLWCDTKNLQSTHLKVFVFFFSFFDCFSKWCQFQYAKPEEKFVSFCLWGMIETLLFKSSGWEREHDRVEASSRQQGACIGAINSRNRKISPAKYSQAMESYMHRNNVPCKGLCTVEARVICRFVTLYFMKFVFIAQCMQDRALFYPPKESPSILGLGYIYIYILGAGS